MEKGSKHTIETIEKMKENSWLKGKIPWNKGKNYKLCGIKIKAKKGWKKKKLYSFSVNCLECNKSILRYSSTIKKRSFCSLQCKGINDKKTLRMSKENHPKWIENRNLLKKRQERNDSAYYNWRMQVWMRDGFKCKINNQNCNGKIITHHILGWSLYPELRYEINNGITLCHAHHPRKRAEEKQLIPKFQELVEVSK